MHPINSRFFGPQIGSLRIKFNNDSTVVEGYIIKQFGSRRYIVTADGTTNYVVTLVTDSAELASIPPGKATIEIDTPNGVENVQTLQTFRCATVQGNSYFWRREEADEPGECNIRLIVDHDSPVQYFLMGLL